MLCRIFVALICVLPIAGCSDSSPTVMDQNVEPDPTLSDDYYNQEEYGAAMNADATPPQ